jgi:ribosomal protein L9
MGEICIDETMKNYMDEIIRKNNDTIVTNKESFNNQNAQNKPNIDKYNNRFKTNKYKFDKYNLLIREKEYNKKSAFGWIYDNEVDESISEEDKQPININIDKIQIRTNATDIQKVTFMKIRVAYQSMSVKNSAPNKIYREFYPELYN